MKIRSIRMRERKGKFSIIYRLTNGKDKSRTLETRDKRVAELVLKNERASLDLGNLDVAKYFFNADYSDMDIKQFFDKYIKYRDDAAKVGRISTGTHKLDLQAIKLFLTRTKVKRLSEVNYEAMDAFLDHLLNHVNQFGRKNSPTYVSLIFRQIKSAMGTAKKWGLVSTNPLSGYHHRALDKQKTDEPSYMTDEQIRIIRETLAKRKSTWLLDAFNLSLWTGIRESSIVNVKDSDITEDELGYFLKVVEKGRRARWIPLSTNALKLLLRRTELIKSGEYKQIVADIRQPDTDENFYRAESGHLFFEVRNPDSVSKSFRKAIIKAFPAGTYIKFHSARHTFATKYLENGGNLETLQEILGHADIKMTQVYAKITKKKIAQNIDLLANI